MNATKVHTIDLNFQKQASSIASYLVELPEGPIIVETGPHSTIGAVKDYLDQLGYKMSDIQHVLLTHIHLDHAGAAWCFAQHGAKIYLHPKGYRHMHDPSKLLASAKMIYKEYMDMLWGTLQPIHQEQLVVVEHQQPYQILGQTFIPHFTPGHAKHHIAWQMDNQVFAGDVAGVCINNGPVLPPCPPPDIHVEDWLDSIDLLMQLEEVNTYFLAHFGEVNDVQSHMTKLKKNLLAFSNFIEPFARKGTDVKEVIPQFLEFANGLFDGTHLKQSDNQSYQTSNPMAGSVPGLMRYWKKRLEQEAGTT